MMVTRPYLKESKRFLVTVLLFCWTCVSPIQLLGQPSTASQVSELLQQGRIGDALTIGDTLHRQGRFSDSADVFRQIAGFAEGLGEQNLQAEALVRQGQAELANGSFLESLVTAQKCLRVLEDLPACLHLLGLSNYSLDQLTDAGKAFEDALRLEPQNVGYLFNLALVRLRQSDMQAAEAALVKAVEIDPGFGQGHLYLGRLLNTQNRNRQAVDHLEKARQLNPDSDGLLYHLGLAYKALGNDLKAIEILLIHVQKQPDAAAPRITLGDCYLRINEWDKALLQFRRATEIEPNRAKSHYLLAKALIELGRLDEALSSLQRSSSLEPTTEEPHYLMAQVYRRLGQIDEAKAQIELYKVKKGVSRFLRDQEIRDTGGRPR
ncbi:MAG: tetratricopeptide repeat protein [Acidobacteriota bacterium]|nr:MAG: tetratricopeptide repeat protein [Acidobacteriota bacterium]